MIQHTNQPDQTPLDIALFVIVSIVMTAVFYGFIFGAQA
jgi:hypothetical protein